MSLYALNGRKKEPLNFKINGSKINFSIKTRNPHLLQNILGMYFLFDSNLDKDLMIQSLHRGECYSACKWFSRTSQENLVLLPLRIQGDGNKIIFLILGFGQFASLVCREIFFEVFLKKIPSHDSIL